MKALVVLVALGAVACSDLSQPHPIRVVKDGAAEPMIGDAVVPGNLVAIPGPSGKPIAVPRLNPPGHPRAGMPVEAGDLPARRAPAK